MNRSILIVIVDFLLVSLLVFSSPDLAKISDPTEEKPDQAETARPTNSPDLAATMKLALEDERRNKDVILNELNRSKQTATEQQQQLAEREKQSQTLSQQIQDRDQQAQKLAEQQAALQAQYTAAQTNLQALNQQLQTSSTQAALSKEKLDAMEAELRKQAEQAAAMQKQMSQLAQSNQSVLAEKQQLSTQLQVAEVERKAAVQTATQAQEEVKVERQEKEKLAEGVKALATQSGALVQEVRDNRPLTPNTIFNDLITNRLQASFTASRAAMFGKDSQHRKDTQTVLVTDGTNTFAVCHVQDTPFSFWSPGTDWDGLAGSLSGNTTILPIHSIAFHLQDPRVVLIPVTDAEARQLGSKIYKVSPDPFKFQDCVLVGARDGYYGECKFEIDLTTPDYVKLDRSFLKGLFGKFNPSSGDLVFGKNGELLGIMVNGTYCLMVHNLNASASFRFSDNVKDQHTGQTLAKLYAQVMELPFKLQ